MNISYNWLKRYLDTDLPAEEIARILTDIGLEVEGFEKIETVKGGLHGVVVGEVLTCTDHPDSDHLHLTTVDVGAGDPLQIVCGAPNCRAGLKVLCATVGTVLYPGGNAKMSEFHAAMGLCNLRHLDENIEKRRHVVELYDCLLSGHEGIVCPKKQTGVVSNYAYYPVRFTGQAGSRDEICARLAAEESIYANVISASTQKLSEEVYGSMLLGIPNSQFDRAWQFFRTIPNLQAEEVSVDVQ